MSDTTRPDPDNPVTPQPTSEHAAGAVGEPAPQTLPQPEAAGSSETAAPEIPAAQLKEMVEALAENVEQLKNENLRLLADMDNLRKRTEREKEETAKFAISRLAGDLIGVVDNFERAIAAVPRGSVEADPALAGLLEGVSLIEREMKVVLERHGVKRIWPEGEVFNPHQHQAVMQQENPDVLPGTILQVYQAGYLIEERVVRPAMVVVAKGGVKSSRTTNGAEAQPSATPANSNES